MQNSLSKFHHFSFQSFKFEFCHFNPPNARLDSAFSIESCVTFFHFFFPPSLHAFCFRPRDNYYCSSTVVVLFMYCSSTVHVFKNIKNGSHDTIHTFKNYFAKVFLVSTTISSIQTDPKFHSFLIKSSVCCCR